VPAGFAAGETLNGLGHEGEADGVGRDVHLGQVLRRDEGDATGGGAQVGGIDEKDARAAGRDDGNEETFGDGLDVEEAEGGARFECGDDGGTEGVVAAKGVSDADDGEGRPGFALRGFRLRSGAPELRRDKSPWQGRQEGAQGGGEPSGGVAEIEGGLGHF